MSKRTLFFFLRSALNLILMSVLKSARMKTGYDSEELWFHQRDRELIDKMKSKPHLTLIQGGADQQREKEESSEEEDEITDKVA